jgi:transcription elongation factor Elf1
MAQQVHDADELVPEIWTCPYCGEDRMDYLAIDEDDNVRCLNCHEEYSIAFRQENVTELVTAPSPAWQDTAAAWYIETD